MARRRRDRVQINAEINVVSLIDVMMLLLVIFMITAPMMQGGIEVKLPEAEAQPLEAKSGLVVTLTRDGAVYVDRTRMTLREFRGSFRSLAGPRAKQGGYLVADENVSYGRVAEVLGIMRAAGLTDVGLSVQPIREK
jgi:biopolymer transport protein TolR